MSLKYATALALAVLVALTCCSKDEGAHTTEPPARRGLSLFPKDAPGEVTALAIVNGDLIAAGICETPVGFGRLYVARWNGDFWTALADISNSDAPVRISALFEYGGELVVGGKFTSLQGVPAKNVARWDGVAWHAMGDGLRGPVKTLIEWNGELLAGGALSPRSFTDQVGLARWNGTTWEELHPPEGSVFAMQVYRGKLIASCMGYVDAANFSFIDSWDGSTWRNLAKSPNLSGVVYAMQVFGGDLYLGGYFGINDSNAQNLVRWDGVSWHNIAAPPDDEIESLAEYGGDLVVGGGFRTIAGRVVNGLARRDGMGWKEWVPVFSGGPGMPTVVEALIEWDDALIMGGQLHITGPDSTNWIARWDD